MVNDLGRRYGAGIAHGRIADAMSLAGGCVELFDLQSNVKPWGQPDENSLIGAVHRFKPDVVIFGNLHAVTRRSVSLIDSLVKRYPSYWVIHDFWLFTGRCAYTGGCNKYQVGCDADCPTADEYPDLKTQEIRTSWEAKKNLMTTNPPRFLSNSSWTKERANELIQAISGNTLPIETIKIGDSIDRFKPTDKVEARKKFGIDVGSFVVAFSVSSFTDKRKGGELLIEAIQSLNLDNFTLLLIGNLNNPLKLEGKTIVSIGYVDDEATLCAAYNAANIYVGPSIEETFGQVFMEAALCGTPSIGFDRG